MTMKHTRALATLGFGLVMAAGAAGVAGAHEMMGGGMHTGARDQAPGNMMGSGPMMGSMHGMMGGMMQNHPMMGGSSGMHGMHGMGMMHGAGKGMAGPGMQGGMGLMGGLVELTDEQQSQLRKLRSEHRQELFARMADMLDLRDEMQALMAEQRPDPEAVRQLHGRMADLRGEMLADRVRMRNAIQDMLTEDQREAMRAYRQEGRGMPGGQHGIPGGGRHGGPQQQHHHGSQGR